MKKNEGELDRIIRVVIGLIIIALGILNESWWGLVGLLPLFTGIAGRCLLYVPFGISTCKSKDALK
jgi:hypothetical protein